MSVATHAIPARQRFARSDVNRQPTLWLATMTRAVRAMTLIVTVGLLAGCLDEMEPDLANLKTFGDDRVAFSYPGNWRVEVDADNATIQTISSSGAMYLGVIAELDGLTVTEWAELFDDGRSTLPTWLFESRPTETPEIASAGPLQTYTQKSEDVFLSLIRLPYVTIHTRHEHEENVVMTTLVVAEEDYAIIRPGYELVRSSLALKP
ncbi:MAG: hypothetical protein AAGJ70_02630 [Pseudomonadota bacterium]